MKLTIGMPSYNNFTEVFYTVQSLRMHHNLTDCEILVVDNYGDENLEKFIKGQGSNHEEAFKIQKKGPEEIARARKAGVVRYEKYTDSVGPSCAKNKVFELAKGEMVLCIDSHTLLVPGALDNIPVTDDLVHGPIMYCDTVNFCCEWKPMWRGQMWGIWGPYIQKLPTEPFDIWGNGMGCFLAKRETWLGFNPRFRGFGGEEGYIHEKYRKAGRRVICLPSLVWMHQFDNRTRTYPLKTVDRVRNYLIGFEELGIDPKPMEEHFIAEKFPNIVKEAKAMIEKENIPTYVPKGVSLLSKRSERLTFGVNSNMLGTGRGDLFFMEYVVAKHNKFSNFIELGTFGGVTSMYLGIIAALRGAPLHTFDLSDRRLKNIKDNWLPNMYFVKEDVLKEPNSKVVELLSKEDTFIFIDNGNKVKEFGLYVPHLSSNSVVVVHDWNEEISLAKIEGIIKEHNLVPYFNEVAEDMRSSCRGWIKQ